jgi:hypothetical protein
MATIKAPTTEAPTRRLCWKRPPLNGGVNPMLPPCDRQQGHQGKHSWELPGALRIIVEALRKTADALTVPEVASLIRDISDKLEALL